MKNEVSDLSVRTFLATYPADFGWESQQVWEIHDTVKILGSDVQSFSSFLSHFSAPSHGNGVLKFLSNVSTPTLSEWNSSEGWRSDWPNWQDRLVVFAYDWNGSLFGFDVIRKRNGEPLVSILEPDTGELLQTPHSFSEFLVHSATDEADGALSISFYRQWLLRNGEVPKPGMCAGSKVPLFLNGADSTENLSIQNLAVYVSCCGQLYIESKKYPPGTKFSGVSIS